MANLATLPKKRLVAEPTTSGCCQEHAVCHLQTGTNQREGEVQRTRRRKRSCRALCYKQQRCFCGQSVGGCFAIGRKHVTLLPLMLWSNSPQLSRLSPSLKQMCTLTRTRSNTPSRLSFSMFLVIRVTQGQFSPSHHLQPVLMSPFFFLKSSRQTAAP